MFVGANIGNRSTRAPVGRWSLKVFISYQQGSASAAGSLMSALVTGWYRNALNATWHWLKNALDVGWPLNTRQPVCASRAPGEAVGAFSQRFKSLRGGVKHVLGFLLLLLLIVAFSVATYIDTGGRVVAYMASIGRQTFHRVLHRAGRYLTTLDLAVRQTGGRARASFVTPEAIRFGLANQPLMTITGNDPHSQPIGARRGPSTFGLVGLSLVSGEGDVAWPDVL